MNDRLPGRALPCAGLSSRGTHPPFPASATGPRSSAEICLPVLAPASGPAASPRALSPPSALPSVPGSRRDARSPIGPVEGPTRGKNHAETSVSRWEPAALDCEGRRGRTARRDSARVTRPPRGAHRVWRVRLCRDRCPAVRVQNATTVESLAVGSSWIVVDRASSDSSMDDFADSHRRRTIIGREPSGGVRGVGWV